MKILISGITGRMGQELLKEIEKVMNLVFVLDMIKRSAIVKYQYIAT